MSIILGQPASVKVHVRRSVLDACGSTGHVFSPGMSYDCTKRLISRDLNFCRGRSGACLNCNALACLKCRPNNSHGHIVDML